MVREKSALPVTTSHPYVTRIDFAHRELSGVVDQCQLCGRSHQFCLFSWFCGPALASTLPTHRYVTTRNVWLYFLAVVSNHKSRILTMTATENMAPEIDVIILQSIRCSLIWPVWLPRLKPITAHWIHGWINPAVPNPWPWTGTGPWVMWFRAAHKE